MGKQNRKRRGGAASQRKQNRNGRTGNPTAAKLLQILAPEWSAVLKSGRLERIVVVEDEEEYERMWGHFQGLSHEDQLNHSTIVDAGHISFLECTTAKSRNSQHNGLFLAVKAPGRDDTHYAAIFRPWSELELESMFKKPSAAEIGKEDELMESVIVSDTTSGGIGSRCAVSLACPARARELIEGAARDQVASGQMCKAEIRAADDDTATSQNQVYEKLPSSLMSGSIANLLGLLFLRTIHTNYLTATKQKQVPLVRFCWTDYLYLEDSLPTFTALENNAEIVPSGEEPRTIIRKLFSCPFNIWKSEQDDIVKACAAKLLSFHAQCMANSLMVEQKKAKPKEKPSSKKNESQRIVQSVLNDIVRDLKPSPQTCGNSAPPPKTPEDLPAQEKQSDGSLSAATVFDEEGWKKVEAGARKNRRHSTKSVKPSSSRRSPSPALVPPHTKHKRGASAEIVKASYSPRKMNGDSPAFSPTSNTLNSWPSPSVLLSAPCPTQQRSRAESADTISLSSAASVSTAERPVPYASNMKAIHPSIISLLDNDLEEMSTLLEEVAERRRPWQLAVAERIKAAVEQMFFGATAQVFGSLATGLAAPCSDVDMVVRNFSQPSRVVMRMLFEYLQGQTWVTAIQDVKHAPVPVIRLTTAQIPISFGNQGSLITVDITFDDKISHRGLRTCIFVQGLLQRYPALKPLTLVLKQFLVEKGLNDPFVGGLSSYGLVVMISAVLQRTFPRGMPASDVLPRHLGVLFVSFLCEYASVSFIEKGVWVYTTNVSSSEGHNRATQELKNAVEVAKQTKAPLYVLDPLDINNNIGRTCFGIHQVIQAFHEALEAIQLTAISQGSSASWSVLGSVFSTGHHKHVVNLVTQVWCPRENPVAPKTSGMTMREWAITAKSVLETMEQKERVCPWCHRKPHLPTCTLTSLLLTFPGNEV